MAEGDEEDQVNSVNAEGVRALQKKEKVMKRNRSGSAASEGEPIMDEIQEDEEEQEHAGRDGCSIRMDKCRWLAT